VDGVDRGSAPVLVGDLDPGEHRVVVTSRGTVYRRTVVLAPGATSTVVIGAAAAGPAAGWLRVNVPIPLQIHEGDRLLGTTESEVLMLPAGERDLAFSSSVYGFEATRRVRIVPGETATVSLAVPRAAVNINATPWADVWVGNEQIGQTPLGNHLLPIGRHEVELRHPELGTRRVAFEVTLTGANRLAVNMRDR
jgi:hypothetical protein